MPAGIWRQSEEVLDLMMKFVIAGVVGLAVAAGLGVAGYQAGLFDSFKPAVSEQQQSVQQQSAPAAETTVAKDAADTSAPPAAEPSILPTFDVVRIEKTGDAVIAGLAEPKAMVALVANGAVIAKTTANSSGEWAIVLEKPLAPGDYDVAIRAESADAAKAVESLQRVTVSIPQDQGEVLVVMNAEGEASTILQKPMTASESDKTAAAAAQGQGDAAQTTTEKTRAAAALQEETAKPEETRPAVVAAAESPATEEKPAADAGATDPQAQGEQPAEAEKSEEPVVIAEAPVAEPAAGPETAKETEAEPETVAEAPAEPATAPEPAAEAAAPVKTEEAPAETVVAAAPAAVTAEPTAAEATPAAPAEAPAATPEAPAAAAEPAAAPEAETAAPAGEPPAAETQAASEPEAPAAVSNPAVSVEAVETENGRLFVAGTSELGAAVRIYVGEEHVGDVQAGTNGRWLLEAETPLAVGQHIVRADQVSASDGTVVARAEVTFEREADEVILRPVAAAGDASGTGAAGGEGAAAVAQLPNVIIRRGDNLWQISKRLYGHGLRYTTIYQANKDQIRNPDLIYPGQVFLTPKGDASWNDPSAPATVN